jgi:hypothetical protein
MKNTTRIIIGALLIPVTPLAITTTVAQTVETTQTTTTSQGTISEFGPQLLVIKTETVGEPLRYTSSKTTTYVDEAGQPVSVTTVKSGLPVTVYYTKVGDAMVASKVIVRKAISSSPGMVAHAGSTTNGSIREFTTGGVILTPDPVLYTYTTGTTYVDEAGRPVSVNAVKAGTPVTVHYTKTGDTMVASKVVVRTSVALPPPVVETKRTTTTTTDKK